MCWLPRMRSTSAISSSRLFTLRYHRFKSTSLLSRSIRSKTRSQRLVSFSLPFRVSISTILSLFSRSIVSFKALFPRVETNHHIGTKRIANWASLNFSSSLRIHGTTLETYGSPVRSVARRLIKMSCLAYLFN